MSSEHSRPLKGIVIATPRYDIAIEAAKRTDETREERAPEFGLGSPRRDSRSLANSAAEYVARRRRELGLTSPARVNPEEMNKRTTYY